MNLLTVSSFWRHGSPNLLTVSGFGDLGAVILKQFLVWEARVLEYVDSFRIWRPGNLNLLSVSGFGSLGAII